MSITSSKLFIAHASYGRPHYAWRETLSPTAITLVSETTQKIRKGSGNEFLIVCAVSVLHAWFLFCLRSFCFVCVVSVLFAWFCFVCVVSVLCAWFLFCLRGFYFVCVVSFFFFFLFAFSFFFAWFLFYLRGFCFVYVFSFLFGWFLFCLQRVPCGPSYRPQHRGWGAHKVSAYHTL